MTEARRRPFEAARETLSRVARRTELLAEQAATRATQRAGEEDRSADRLHAIANEIRTLRADELGDRSSAEREADAGSE